VSGAHDDLLIDSSGYIAGTAGIVPIDQVVNTRLLGRMRTARTEKSPTP
jgi:hypothetical protein